MKSGRIFCSLLLLIAVNALAQTPDTDWLIYTRAIRDSKGNFRFDQNVVPNFKVSKLLRVELGLRHGENTMAFDAYYHYKVELQTKWFWHSVRFITRLSDNIWKSPVVYSRSNYLAIAESRLPIVANLSVLFGAGAVAQFQKNNVTEVVPTFGGTRKVFPTYRLSLRYSFSKSWFVDAVYGAYDTFNPYQTSAPFLQADSEYELTEHVTLYGYFRYQFENAVDNNVNDFLGVGVRLHR